MKMPIHSQTVGNLETIASIVTAPVLSERKMGEYPLTVEFAFCELVRNEMRTMAQAGMLVRDLHASCKRQFSVPALVDESLQGRSPSVPLEVYTKLAHKRLQWTAKEIAGLSGSSLRQSVRRRLAMLIAFPWKTKGHLRFVR